MSQRTENQVAEMKKQTIGVEVEMNSITREKAARLAATFFGTGRYENTACRNGYSTWSAWDESGREWKFQKDVSIAGPDSEKCEMISYRLPAEAVKAGMKEEQVCPLAYAGHSRVGYFDVFMQGTGKKRHWEDVDFEALTEKFDKAAEKGKRAKMQPKARLDAKKTCVDEAMRVMREQTDNSGDKEQENQK